MGEMMGGLEGIAGGDDFGNMANALNAMGGLIGFVGARNEGRRQAGIAEANALIARMNASNERARATYEAARVDERVRRAIARQKASQQGVRAVGTPVDVVGAIAGEASWTRSPRSMAANWQPSIKRARRGFSERGPPPRGPAATCARASPR